MQGDNFEIDFDFEFDAPKTKIDFNNLNTSALSDQLDSWFEQRPATLEMDPFFGSAVKSSASKLKKSKSTGTENIPLNHTPHRSFKTPMKSSTQKKGLNNSLLKSGPERVPKSNQKVSKTPMKAKPIAATRTPISSKPVAASPKLPVPPPTLASPHIEDLEVSSQPKPQENTLRQSIQSQKTELYDIDVVPSESHPKATTNILSPIQSDQTTEPKLSCASTSQVVSQPAQSDKNSTSNRSTTQSSKTPSSKAAPKMTSKTPNPKPETKMTSKTPNPKTSTKMTSKTPNPKTSTKMTSKTPNPKTSTKMTSKTPNPKLTQSKPFNLTTSKTPNPKSNTQITSKTPRVLQPVSKSSKETAKTPVALKSLQPKTPLAYNFKKSSTLFQPTASAMQKTVEKKRPQLSTHSHHFTSDKENLPRYGGQSRATVPAKKAIQIANVDLMRKTVQTTRQNQRTRAVDSARGLTRPKSPKFATNRIPREKPISTQDRVVSTMKKKTVPSATTTRMTAIERLSKPKAITPFQKRTQQMAHTFKKPSPTTKKSPLHSKKFNGLTRPRSPKFASSLRTRVEKLSVQQQNNNIASQKPKTPSSKKSHTLTSPHSPKFMTRQRMAHRY